MRHFISSLLSLLLLIIMLSGGVIASSSQSTTNHDEDSAAKTTTSSSSTAPSNKRARVSPNHYNQNSNNTTETNEVGKLEELKQKEVELSQLLAAVRKEKLSIIQARPLTIGIMGFGRFGQFIGRTFQKYGRVVVTSRSNYTDIANGMGVKYIPLSNLDAFFQEDLDVIVVATSIMSFKSTIQSLVPHLQEDLKRRRQLATASGAAAATTTKGDSAKVKGPLIVDVLSVKEHARQVMLDLLPVECDILCTHPMFGPDSGKDGWDGLNFVYEKTRINQVVLEQQQQQQQQQQQSNNNSNQEASVDSVGQIHSMQDEDDEDGVDATNSSTSGESHVEAMDRMERFLSIWEEEGCQMVPMSAKDHDAYAANSQFITHLMGRILGLQGLSPTPIDTKGFQSVLKLIESTTADSFDLFYGLYKFNQNSLDTIVQLQSAMDEVVTRLQVMEQQEQEKADNPPPARR